MTAATSEAEVRTLNAAIVGCGNVAPRYAEALAGHPHRLRLVGACDLERPRAEAVAALFAGATYGSLHDVLGDETVDLVVNLTVPWRHAEVTAQCLERGKHVYSEKPLSLRADEARQLVALAEQSGVRLACAPSTFLGEAQQTAWKLIRDGRIGTVRAVYADANWGRIESWHPRPQTLFEVGPLIDVGVYPLTVLTTFLGPARSVVATGRTLLPERTTLDGTAFSPAAPDFVCAIVEFGNGCLARITMNFYVGQSSRQHGIEFHGDDGSLRLTNIQDFDCAVELAEGDAPAVAVPPLRAPSARIDWARGVIDLVDAISAGGRQRVTGAHAAHVVEILTAAATSIEEGRRVGVSSEFESPLPMDWAR